MSRIRRLLFVTAITLLFFATGCQSPKSAVEVISFQPSDYEVLFYSNSPDDGALEDKYKDAIIDLKAKYPDQFENMKAFTEDISNLKVSGSKEGPNLLILKDGDTVSHLNGDQPKQEILNHLEYTLE
ncbi:hypothetical protein [Virgibacillus sediminis]|uniref:Small peptidoglycan-associated lipoprotein n=1 Tax=Virgibacillus sediminis TaxID=202260 RepID=A0ABV7ABM4_9BACI